MSPKVESRHHRLLVESPNHATEIWTSLNPVFVKSLHSMVPQVKLAGLQEEVNAEWSGDLSHYDCPHMLYHLILALHKRV